MPSKTSIASELYDALSGRKPLSIDLYVEALADRGKGAMVVVVLLDPAHVIRCDLAFDGSAAARRSPLQKSGKGDLLGKNVLFYRQG
ncbi:MAG: hypothetical protein EBZ03_11155 [Betaproteobacteria bacterium]|nr:hypothetical protein [Betaproteobacteria bacterium]NBQ82508.1 hypothetical protein [Betaproteobacteria bacterium]NCX12109.1 hypothetical protein [Betaproteobacteria bacterium]NCX73354.1 hypothetical protein [Betaproteobacteria bacterium]NCZ46804.1 hypothetical protein [Betaproteobacteria bacterium]